jgi:Holliday junction resolvase
MTHSRNKGKRGELELAHWLTDRGFPATRGQQFKGGGDSPDVVCPSLPNIHIECKRVEAGNPYKWMEQATRDAGEKLPIVFHRKNGQDWIAILPADKLLQLIIGF